MPSHTPQERRRKRNRTLQSTTRELSSIDQNRELHPLVREKLQQFGTREGSEALVRQSMSRPMSSLESENRTFGNRRFRQRRDSSTLPFGLRPSGSLEEERARRIRLGKKPKEKSLVDQLSGLFQGFLNGR